MLVKENGQRYFGFKIESQYYRINDTRYLLTRPSLDTLRRLIALRVALFGRKGKFPESVSKPSLSMIKENIKAIVDHNKSTTLCLVIATSPDPYMRLIAIWMRGWCKGKIGTTIVSAHHDDKSKLVRKEVARALKRMSAWHELRIMADRETDPKIKKLASQRSPRPHGARMTKLVGNLSRREVNPEKVELYVDPDLAVELVDARGSFFFRRLLLRIRRAVVRE